MYINAASQDQNLHIGTIVTFTETITVTIAKTFAFCTSKLSLSVDKISGKII
jgi:hypothetical protein